VRIASDFNLNNGSDIILEMSFKPNSTPQN